MQEPRPIPASHVRALAVLIALSLLLRLGMIWIDSGLLTCGLEVLQDDSVINFVYARNIAEGKGVTFEEGESVFGFHPPSVLFILPFFRLFPESKTIPIQCLLTMYTLFSLATSLLIYRIVRRAAGDHAALLSAGVWVFGYGIVVYSLCGSDAPFTMFLLALTFDYYLGNVRPADSPGMKTYLMLGALCGLCMVARADTALLPVAFGVSIIMANRRNLFRGGFSKIVVAGTAMVLGLLLVTTPFLLWQKITFGSIQLHSASTCRELSAVMGHYIRTLGLGKVLYMMKNHLHGDPLSPLLTELGDNPYPIWWGLYLFCLAKSVAVLFAKYGEVYIPLGLFSVLAVLWALRRKKGERVQGVRIFLRESGIDKLGVVLLYGLLHFSAYAFYQLSYWHLARYMYPMALVGAIYLGPVGMWVFNRILSPFLSRPAPALRAVLGVILLCLLSFSWRVYSNLYLNLCEGGNGFIQAAEWINRNTPKDAVVGFYQSGYFGYFIDRKIHDLGGKVTAEAWDAWFNRREWDHIRERGVDYILDEDHYLDFLFAWGKMYPIEDRLELVNQDFGRKAGTRILIFKVKKPEASEAGAAAGDASPLGSMH